MIKKAPSVLVILLSLIVSCNTTNDTVVLKNKNTEVKKIDEDGNKKHVNSENVELTLINQLKKIGGVSVSGSGSDVVISIRGLSSINLRNDSLFVLNDQIVDGGYAAIVNLIDPSEIKHIEVLKNANEISYYGSRGANGIIKITTK
jgi:TonB-dependent SusC/RagA subfamily outer membrane receptor